MHVLHESLPFGELRLFYGQQRNFILGLYHLLLALFQFMFQVQIDQIQFLAGLEQPFLHFPHSRH